MKKPLLFGIILTVCIVIVAFVFAQVNPEGMISYWKFEEGSGSIAIDSVDANHGILFYGPGWTTGQVDGALGFDGVNEYVEVPDHASLDFGPGQDFSLEAWIKAPAQAGWQGTILAKLNAPYKLSGSPKRDTGYSLVVRGVQDESNEGKIGVWLGDEDGIEIGDGPFQLYSVVTYDDDTWHHVVATMDRDGLAVLYIDGLEVNHDDISYLSAVDESNNENLEIGREGVVDKYWFKGLIDEVAIYNRVLTACEIYQHYNSGLAGKGYTLEDTIETLIISVGGLDLPKGIEKSLASQLDNALDSLERGRDTAARKQLEAFIYTVEALRGKKLTDDEADALIEAVQCIIDNI